MRVNGTTSDSPALNVTHDDRIEVDGQPLAQAEAPRMWRYYKPTGLVTSARDEKGRATVFDRLPEGMPRVMSIGRLDLNSEGLLLLTNDGELKRKLELPATGWTRKYRVRAKGVATEAMLAPLLRGLVIEGERFRPMQVTIDRQQGANCWLTVGLKEGKNREIRRAFAEVGLEVNRLIRVSYGPFQLGEMREGEVEEIKGKILRDQLGIKAEPLAEQRARQSDAPGGRSGGKPGGRSPYGKGPTGRGGNGGGRTTASDPSRSLRKKR